MQTAITQENWHETKKFKIYVLYIMIMKMIPNTTSIQHVQQLKQQNIPKRESKL